MLRNQEDHCADFQEMRNFFDHALSGSTPCLRLIPSNLLSSIPMDASPDFFFFSPVEPRRTGMLPVDDLHAFYWEESGNPDGIPIVYVRRGPGGCSSPEKRQWYDPDAYRIILFDQRGAFRAMPLGEVETKAHADFVDRIPEQERNDILCAYEKRLFSEDMDIRMDAVHRWFRYTEACSLLRQDPKLIEEASKNDDVVYGTGRLDAFYFRHNMFLEEDQSVANIGRIAHLPVQALEQFKRDTRFDAVALAASGPV